MSYTDTTGFENIRSDQEELGNVSSPSVHDTVSPAASAGHFNPDLADRALTLHLEAYGDIEHGPLAMGNPWHEYLPQNRRVIEAGLCGLVEKWENMGCPIDGSVKHPMTECAQTVGGLLNANGFKCFLSSLNHQRNATDDERESLALIAKSLPHNMFLRVSDFHEALEAQVAVCSLMNVRHRETTKSIERQLGVLLSSHLDEMPTLAKDGHVVLHLISKDRRSIDKQIATVSQFTVKDEAAPRVISGLSVWSNITGAE